MSEANEIWQVEVNGAVYDAAFSELPDWIDGGSLLPGDKVRKGNLRWIEARRVPSLVPFFNAKERGAPMPVVVTVNEQLPEAGTPVDVPIHAQTVEAATSSPEPGIAVPTPAVFDPTKCAIHSDVDSFFLCDGCANGFCKTCPTSYGGTVKICPMCGSMCRRADEVRATSQARLKESHAISEGFGASDFFTALAHPFNFKVSLFFGAFLFMIFTLGKSAGAFGGIFMVVGGIFSGMSANALSFGVLSNTIDNFIQGKLDENFMPDFDNFELWEDVIHPFFLSIAAYISSFGPFMITLAIGFWLVTSSVQSSLDAYQSDLEKIPGTHIYNGRELVDQSGDVKEVLSGIDQRQRDRINAIENGDETDPSVNTAAGPVVDEESRQQEELWAEVTEARKQSLESALGKSAETEAREYDETVKAFLSLAAPLVVVGFITFVWGLFLFPAACAVAGYSKSFLATINPLISLDTIKRLGVDYVKILLMGFVLLVASVIVSTILSLIFAPLNLPGLGNLPATAVGALFTFYLVAVFSCLLGYALYKRADKLGLLR